MENNIQIFENVEFGKVRAMELNGEPWFVGRDVASALGYGEGKSLANAVANHVDDEDKGVTEMMTPGGKQKMVIINESGLYSLVLSSKLPSAKKFKRWVTSEVLPSIRKNHSYSMPQKQNHSEQTDAQKIKANLAEAKLLNAKARLASYWVRSAEQVKGQDYKQICVHYATEVLHGTPVIPLPVSEQKYYSATEIGKMFGVSANKIGKISNENNLKIDKYGKWFHDKSRYSSKEVDSFRYNDEAIKAFQAIISNNK